MRTAETRIRATALALLSGVAAAALVDDAHAAASIVINNVNQPGVGFNDTTPAAPVGGNSGTTLGQQRLIAFTFAANQWGATLTSTQPIVINAQFSALSCTSTSAVLGSAGATSVFQNFANAPKAGTWYPYALANKLSGTYLGTANAPQINANFNANLGKTGCLDGSFFYLGTDNLHPAGTVDFVTVLLHEMGHGLGFQTFTDGSTGKPLNGVPSIWDHFLLGTATNKLWKDMTNAERKASAVSVNKLVWSGSAVNTALPSVLTQGTPQLSISGPGAGPAAGTYQVSAAPFGRPISGTPVSGKVKAVVDQSNGTGLACTALSSTNAAAVNGNIALVDRGTCNFTVKVKNAQNAGAIGVLIADNAAGSPPFGLSGSDPTITIVSAGITQADGATIKTQLAKRRPADVIGSLSTAGSQYQGADALGRMQLYSPNPFQGGSSVSHYDVTAFRNQLMEPAINDDLTHSVLVPQDLTFKLLQDIGW